MDWLLPFKTDVERRLNAAYEADDAAAIAHQSAARHHQATTIARTNLSNLLASIERLEQSADEAEVPL